MTPRRARSLLRLHPRRLLVAPRVAIAADGAVRVEGMVCALCAARARSALAAVPGVAAVVVDLEAGTAMLQRAPGVAPAAAREGVAPAALEPALQAALQAALERVVVGMRARRWIERAARRVRARGG